MRLRHRLAAGLALATLATSAQAQAQRRLDLDLPAQPLARSLVDLSSRSGVVIVAPAALTANRAAPRVTGRMTAREALPRLLAGSGLTFGVEANGVILIRRAPPVVVAPSPAHAAPEPVEDLPVSVITVVARPLGEAAASQDRISPRLIDILVEDDLQRAGPGGVGDALARLPGASASLDAGEARQLAVRGVGARFTLVRVNGLETLATFGATNAGGGTNRGRAFDYNVFAADLFHQVRLQKTASADLEEGSLGASVDMRTRSPFDLPARSLRMTAEATHNGASGRTAPGVSLLASVRDRDDRLGFLISAAYRERTTAETGASAGQWESGTAIFPGFAASRSGESLEVLNQALHARIPRLEAVRADQRRLGLTASLEWRPDDQTHITADLLYASLHVERREDLLESFTFRTAGGCDAQGCGLGGVTVTEAQIVDQGGRVPVLIAGTFDNVDVRSEARRDILKTVFRQSTLSATRRLGDGYKASVLLGYSRSDFGNPRRDTIWLQQSGVTGFAYDFSDAKLPRVTFGSANLTGAAAWRVAEFRAEPNWVDNIHKSAAFDIERDGPVAWRAGVLHRRYVNAATTLSRSNGTIANLNSDVPPDLAAAPIDALSRLISINSAFGAGRWRAMDVERTLAGLARPSLGPETAASLNYAIGETIDAAFVQVARPFRENRRVWGELGLRWIAARYDIDGLGVLASGLVGEQSLERRDRRLLPSLNLAWRVAPDAVLRFGAAKVVARPDLASLRPGLGVSTTGTKMVVVGNPDLEPTQARTLDLALEWRPTDDLGLNLAVFHKSLSTVVQSTVTRPGAFAANPFGLSADVATLACGSSPGCSPDLPIWQFARPANSGEGRLDGVELAFSRRIERGDGVAWRINGAASHARSHVWLIGKSGALVRTEDALGAPRTAAFLSVQRRDGPTSAGVTISHRSAFVATAPAPNGGDVDGVNALTRVDINTSHRLSPAAELTLDVFNLTNAADRQFSDTTHIPTYLHRVGRDVRLGLRMTF
ncbi:TonB-dependent receptor [Caulobacter sp.]|uniref:TonB-dependent receptor n=1 Tax=Caulobacter sp. TaxID=78 RepID=UPI00160C6924